MLNAEGIRELHLNRLDFLRHSLLEFRHCLKACAETDAAAKLWRRTLYYEQLSSNTRSGHCREAFA